jgi:predicted nucleic acid-binding protein
LDISSEASERATSVITYAESRSAIARIGGAASETRRGRTALDALWPQLIRVPADETLALEAGALAERHRLRGMDALQLASALRYAAGVAPETVVFASWDRDQRAAARAEGLELLPSKL